MKAEHAFRRPRQRAGRSLQPFDVDLEVATSTLPVGASTQGHHDRPVDNCQRHR